MTRLLCAGAVLTAASAAHATVQFFPNTNPQPDGQQLVEMSDTQFEARFRADRNNWDSRLEYDGFPDNGDNTAGVENGGSALANFSATDYDFSLTHDSVNGLVTWTLTDTADNTDTTITLITDDMQVANTIKIFTVGSRGEVSLTNMAFNGLGESLVDADFPDLDTSPGGPTFRETLAFFGNATDLYSGDWTLSGNLTFRNFTNTNPSEGAKLTVKVLRTELVPAPGAAALLGIGALASVRRKR